jgi:sugar phosphate isomerase/epimerase
MIYTRREVGKLALAGLPAAGLFLRERAAAAGAFAKPNSKWAGVQVGLNAPYSFGDNAMSSDETLARLVQVGLSAVELRSQPIELFLGAPAAAVTGRGRGRGPAPTGAGGAADAAAAAGAQRGANRGRGPLPLTPEQEAEAKASAAALRKWRLSAPLGKARELRKQWDDAGVLIEIVKFDWICQQGVGAGQTAPPLPDDDLLEYCFQLAKAVGARAISTECPTTRMEDTRHVGLFADKHKIWVGYHNHTAVTPALWEQAFGYAKYNGANFDIGHFVAGQNTSPIPFLKQHHDRITHMHTKDRKLNNGPNVPFGQGDTPVKEALQTIRDNKWNIQATVEFEYPIPEGSNRMAEISKSVQYCKECLLA